MDSNSHLAMKLKGEVLGLSLSALPGFCEDKMVESGNMSSAFSFLEEGLD